MADNPEARSEKVPAIAVNAQSAGWKTRTPPEQPQAGGASRSPQETFVQEGRAPAAILDKLTYTDLTAGPQAMFKQSAAAAATSREDHHSPRLDRASCTGDRRAGPPLRCLK